MIINPFAFISLLAFISNITLGIWIYLKSPYNKINIKFLIFTLPIVSWTICEFLLRVVSDTSAALFFSKLCWASVSFIPAVSYNFISEIIKKKKDIMWSVTHIFLYILGLFFAVAAIFSLFIIKSISQPYWGYTGTPGTFFPFLSIYYSISMFMLIIILYTNYKKIDKKIEKQNILYFLLAFSIPIFTGTIFQVILPLFKIKMFPFASLSTIFMVGIIAYSIIKNQLHIIQPYLNIDFLIENMEASLIVIDNKDRILQVNKYTENFLNTSQEKLINKNIHYLFKTLDKNIREILIKNKKGVIKRNLTINTKSKKDISVSVNIRPILDIKNRYIGSIIICTDISDKMNLIGQLMSAQNELKQWNELLESRVVKRTKELEESQRKMEKMMAELSILYKTTVASTSSLDINTILYKTIKEILNISHAKIGLYMFTKPQNKFYNILKQIGLGAEKANKVRIQVFPDKKYIKEKYKIFNLKKEIPEDRWERKVIPCKSILLISNRFQGGNIGVFEFISLQENTFTEEKIRLINLIIDRVAVSLENAMLLEQIKNARKQLGKKVRLRTMELKGEKDKLYSVIRNISDGVLVIDNSYTIIHRNFAIEDIIGLKKKQLIGTHLKKYFNTIYKSKLVQHKKYFHSEEITITNRIDKTKKELLVYLAPVKIEEKKQIGLSFTIRDITKAKQINEMKSQFVSNVSHEMRTPLSSIKGFASILLGMNNLSEKQKKRFLQIINDESDRLTRLIEDLLSLSKIESSSFKLEFSKFKLEDIILEINKEFENQCKSKDINIKLEYGKCIPNMIADKDKIFQLILNLISNAVKFTKEGTTITINVLYKKKENFFIISIKDEGIGISEKDKKNIFEKFYRIEDQVHTISGTGLGLSIVKSIVDKHKGKISVKSKISKSSTFIVEIPQGNI